MFVEDGIEVFRKVLALNPDSPRCLRDLAECLLLAGKFEESIGHASRALELDPKNARAYDLRSEAYAKLHRTDEGERDAASARSLRRIREVAEEA